MAPDQEQSQHSNNFALRNSSRVELIRQAINVEEEKKETHVDPRLIIADNGNQIAV